MVIIFFLSCRIAFISVFDYYSYLKDGIFVFILHDEFLLCLHWAWRTEEIFGFIRGSPYESQIPLKTTKKE